MKVIVDLSLTFSHATFFSEGETYVYFYFVLISMSLSTSSPALPRNWRVLRRKGCTLASDTARIPFAGTLLQTADCAIA